MTTAAEHIPVFRVKPLNRTNRMIIKYVGQITETDRLGDEVVELDHPIHPDSELYGKHSIPIRRVGEYAMVGRIYRCNIVGDVLIRNTTYPYIYLDIGYDRTMVSGSLLQIFLFFTLDQDEKARITKPNQYIDHEFTGKWVLKIECDEEMVENYQSMLADNHQALNLCRGFMESTEYKFDTKEAARDYLVELCQSQEIHDMLVVAMRCRELNRRKRSNMDNGGGFQYTVPENVTRMDDLGNNLVDNDEIIFD